MKRIWAVLIAFLAAAGAAGCKRGRDQGTMPAQKVAFDKVAPRIKNYLTQQQLGKLAPDYLAKARKEAAVEIIDEKLKPQAEPAGGLPAGHPPVKDKSGSGKPDGK